MSKPSILLVIATLIILSGCNPAVLPPDPPPATLPALESTLPIPEPSATDEEGGAIPTVESSAAGTPQPAPMVTYEDKVTGFNLDYPEGWTLVDLPDDQKTGAQIYSITFYSWTNEEVGTRGQPPEGGSKVNVLVMRDIKPTFDNATGEWRQNIFTNDPAAEFVSDETVDLPGGVKAARWLVRSNGEEFINWVTIVNEVVVVISGTGNLEPLDAIANSFRAITP